MATKIEVTLPARILIRSVDGGGKVELETGKLSAEVIAKIFEGGAVTVLNNAFNGGGKDKTPAEKMAQLEKRLASWYKGDYAMIERGESQFTAMREQFIAEQAAKFGRSRAEAEKVIKATVSAVYGKDEAATFTKFLDAVAQQKLNAEGGATKAGKTLEEVRDAIETALAKRTADAAAERAAIAADLDLTAIDTGL